MNWLLRKSLDILISPYKCLVTGSMDGSVSVRSGSARRTRNRVAREGSIIGVVIRLGEIGIAVEPVIEGQFLQRICQAVASGNGPWVGRGSETLAQWISVFEVVLARTYDLSLVSPYWRRIIAAGIVDRFAYFMRDDGGVTRSEEHTSELQSLRHL